MKGKLWSFLLFLLNVQDNSKKYTLDVRQNRCGRTLGRAILSSPSPNLIHFDETLNIHFGNPSLRLTEAVIPVCLQLQISARLLYAKRSLP